MHLGFTTSPHPLLILRGGKSDFIWLTGSPLGGPHNLLGYLFFEIQCLLQVFQGFPLGQNRSQKRLFLPDSDVQGSREKGFYRNQGRLFRPPKRNGVQIEVPEQVWEFPHFEYKEDLKR